MNPYARSHQYKLSQDVSHHAWLNREIAKTRDELRSLTPAGLHLVITLHEMFEGNHFAPVDRVQIAAALKRPNGLSVWDRRLLDRLVEAKWITCSRVALPVTQHEDGTRAGRGARFVYSMDIDLGWRLFMLNKKAARASS